MLRLIKCFPLVGGKKSTAGNGGFGVCRSILASIIQLSRCDTTVSTRGKAKVTGHILYCNVITRGKQNWNQLVTHIKTMSKNKTKSSLKIHLLFRFSCLCYTKMLNNLNTFLPVIHEFIPTSCTHEVEENNLDSHKT